MCCSRAVTRSLAGVGVACFLACLGVSAQTFDPARGLLLRVTVVTMDESRTILHKGRVLVRECRIVAV